MKSCTSLGWIETTHHRSSLFIDMVCSASVLGMLGCGLVYGLLRRPAS
jgi:hypothetical protein